MSLNKDFLFIYLSFIAFYCSKAQNFEWLLNTNSFSSEIFTDKCIDSQGNIFLIGNFENNISFSNDSSRNTFDNFSSFICKVDTNGSMNWLKVYSSCSFVKIIIQSNNLIIYGFTRDSFKTELGNIVGSNSQRKGFFINFNLNGNLSVIKDLGVINNFSLQKLRKDNNNNIYLTGHITNNLTIESTLIVKQPNSLTDGVLLKFNNSLNLMNYLTFTNTTVVDIAFENQGNYYITGILSGLVGNNSNIGGIILNNVKNDIFYAKFNSVNNIVWAYKIGGNETDQVTSLFLMNNKLFIVGNGYGQINFNGQNFNTKPLNDYNAFIAISDTNGSILNVRFLENSNSIIGEISMNNFNEILMLGLYNSTLTIQNKSISWPLNNCLFVSKFDENLNCLWLLSLNSQGAPLSVISNNKREYYFSGYVYSNFILFGPFYRPLFTTSNNGFLVKISDISIRQGILSKKQYCGGDSLNMPYSITGRFRTGNRFYLQLSNTQGNFDTLVSTLGYRTDTLSGIISVKLPENIIASSMYRFRIISDSPAVTSFYDTIPYHILPKPISLVISDTVLCSGQQVTAGLSQSMGQIYMWQPGFTVTDSTIKQPLIKPTLSAGQYQIKLLAINGHCIAADSFKVTLLPALSIKAPKDTITCKGENLHLSATPQGGDSNNYVFLWYKNHPNHLIQDTMLHTTIIADTSAKFYIQLTDGCSTPAIDSVIVMVGEKKPLIIADTLVCYGSNIAIIPTTDTLFNNFIWHNRLFEALTQTNKKLQIINADSTKLYYLLNKHYCENKTDTYSITISVLPKLNLQLMLDTLLCKNMLNTIKAVATGGMSAKYQIAWLGHEPDTINKFKFDSVLGTYVYVASIRPQADTMLWAVLTDGCTANQATDSLNIRIIKPIHIKPYLPQNVCMGKPIILNPKTNGGKEPIKYNWYQTDTIHIAESDSLYLIKAEKTTFTFIVKDNCQTSDTLIIQLEPNANPKAVFTLPQNTLCQMEGIVPENNTQIEPTQMLNYNWYWHNKQSTLFEPKLIFTDTGKYDIMLTASTPDGCTDTFIITQAITVYAKPVASFAADRLRAPVQDAVFTFANNSNIQQGEGTWLWNFGNGTTSTQQSPTVRYNQSGYYTIRLIATNKWQCSDTITKQNYIYVEPGLQVYLPNAITANADGLNDSFKPIGIDIKTWQMQIYNRWGLLVYECNDNEPPFTGMDKNGKPLAADVYIYTLNIVSNDNVGKTLKGTVTLVR
ncbi:MAG: PKD domain-containing protein [Bacteroidia bacterium]